MDFATSLELAIKRAKGNGLLWALSVSVGSLVFSWLAWRTGDAGESPFIGLVIAICVWPVALSDSKGVAALKSLRGAEPAHWLASTSHGVVLLTDEYLLAGDLRVEFDRYAPRRILSVAFDESVHSLLIGLTVVTKSEGRDRADPTILDVKLDPSVPPERASSFAGKALELSQR